MQGFVNHLFWDGLVPLVGQEKALLWPKKLNCVPTDYHGDAFEGNACRKMLKEADALLDPDIYEDIGQLRLLPFINTFKAMSKLVDCCFSVNGDGSNLRFHVNNVKMCLEATEVSKTLKVHVTLEHLEQCLTFLDTSSLGLYSEQAGESVHSEFLNYWNKYKIKNIDNLNYPVYLKKAVVEFSSAHI